MAQTKNRKQPQGQKMKSGGLSDRVFACGEDAHTLRLVSELPDLRVAHVHLHSLREQDRIKSHKKKKTQTTTRAEDEK